MAILVLNGKEFKLDILELKRKFAVTDTGNSGRVADYSMHRDIIGTFYNYTIKLSAIMGEEESYNSFYEMVSDPDRSSHEVSVPFGGENLTFKAYVTQGEDSLIVREGKNIWGLGQDGLSITFTAIEPQRRR